MSEFENTEFHTHQSECYEIIYGRKKLNEKTLQELCEKSVKVKEEKCNLSPKLNYLYVRVMNKTKIGNISPQIEYLKKWRPEYSSYIPIFDIATGHNLKRKGLLTILDACIQRTVGEIVVIDKEQLSPHHELLEQLVIISGGFITMVENEKHRDGETFVL